MSTRPFNELRTGMSPEAQQQAREEAQRIMEEMKELQRLDDLYSEAHCLQFAAFLWNEVVENSIYKSLPEGRQASGVIQWFLPDGDEIMGEVVLTDPITTWGGFIRLSDGTQLMQSLGNYYSFVDRKEHVDYLKSMGIYVDMDTYEYYLLKK